MKVGGEYQLRDIGLRQWRKLAQEIHVDEDGLISRLTEIASDLPDIISTVRESVRQDGLDQPVVERLEARLIQRAKACGKALVATASE